ncbi:unnamed protein product [Clonostachys chloroleuca]|uniref:NADH-cytochrome b5 reductase 1 n=1 Tax=Clonostachys chloroleuca TaxID=1926264 RepID=A0AA35QCA8_9HYPO|nr:unnamed protein product [Clonostachys chloroleuca]
MTKEFTLADVQLHNTADDLYIVVHNKVYSCASFVADHPGGGELISDVAGQDATEAFVDVGHSEEAAEILETLCVGTLKSAAVSEVSATTPSPATNPETTVDIAPTVIDISPNSISEAKKTEVIEQVKEITISPTTVLRPDSFQFFPLKEKSNISHNVAVYRFSLPSEDSVLGLPIGQHISIGAVLPQPDGTSKEIIRSYTPVSGDHQPGYFDLLIKTYPKGNISKHIEALEIGQSIRVRGPKGAFSYKPNMVRHFGMIAGGTGLTPMLQIVTAIYRGRAAGDMTEVDLIFANVTEQDILLMEDLDALAVADPKFRVHYVLDKPPQGFIGGVGFVTENMIRKWLPKPAPDVKILLCGPPPMISAMKKATENLGFEKARPVSKLEDQVFSF